jgi:DNA polymerase I-like protein with 3'-5' exonuclease and polymerase domains
MLTEKYSILREKISKMLSEKRKTKEEVFKEYADAYKGIQRYHKRIKDGYK